MINNEVANTILAQLGGNRFVVMTGAKEFVAIEFGLQFALPGRMAKNGINKIQIVIAPNDTYTMKFFKYNPRTLDLVEVAQHFGVYCDQLGAIFEEETGLTTRLF